MIGVADPKLYLETKVADHSSATWRQTFTRVYALLQLRKIKITTDLEAEVSEVFKTYVANPILLAGIEGQWLDINNLNGLTSLLDPAFTRELQTTTTPNAPAKTSGASTMSSSVPALDSILIPQEKHSKHEIKLEETKPIKRLSSGLENSNDHNPILLPSSYERNSERTCYTKIQSSKFTITPGNKRDLLKCAGIQ